MDKLAQLVREIVDAHLDEMARPSDFIRIADPEKAEKVKRLYAGTWVADMVQHIIDAGEAGITRGGEKNPETRQYEGGLAQLLDKKSDKLNYELDALATNGVISRARPEKAPKPASTGKRGRPKTKTDNLDDLRAAMNSEEEPLTEQFIRMKKLAGLL